MNEPINKFYSIPLVYFSNFFENKTDTYEKSKKNMESFNQCLETMRQKCVIRDAEYWDLQLMEGEIPISEECNETTLSVTFQGFNIFMEMRNYS